MIIGQNSMAERVRLIDRESLSVNPSDIIKKEDIQVKTSEVEINSSIKGDVVNLSDRLKGRLGDLIRKNDDKGKKKSKIEEVHMSTESIVTPAPRLEDPKPSPKISHFLRLLNII